MATPETDTAPRSALLESRPVHRHLENHEETLKVAPEDLPYRQKWIDAAGWKTRRAAGQEPSYGQYLKRLPGRTD